jgi:ketosteroid isomerase-like protein
VDTRTSSVRPGELAAQIVQAADPDEIAELLAEDVTWWISPAVPTEIMPSVTHGREPMRENLKRVFSRLYVEGSQQTTVHQTISEGRFGAARWSMSGAFPTGGRFRNEYCIWVEVENGRAMRVWEYVDLAHTNAQMEAGRRAES